MKAEALHIETSGSGSPVVLLHGFGATLFTWRLLLPFFSSRFEVTLVDLLGCGASPKPVSGDYSIRGHSRRLEQLLAERRLQDVTLVAHSLGGAIALLTALRLQGGGQISKLVLIAAPAYRQRMPLFIQILSSPFGPTLTALVPPRIQVRAVLQLAYYEDAAISKDSVRAYAAALASGGGRHALVRTARELIPADIDAISAQYPLLTTPTLLLWGEHDGIVPLTTGERLARELPHATLHVVSGAGHLPQEEQPVQTVEAIRRFLASEDRFPRGAF